ncbi:hypothetical protein F7731_18110 [Cytobacillus depressus]|uniref:Uncharacterized protein n=1 Tax=Cytobacillus depressus TaxID=1602942 RepID=A0A6L3V361_9BACI|nr:hypothetical protein [Cytobacillus depressus]KAB2331508.1 hypothetical protein F7731_18110 [Cytobacillus depressus]
MGIFGPVFVNLLVFKVNAIDRGSALSLGPNQHVDSFLSNKQNLGFGEENGDFCVTNLPMVLLNDSDLNDTNSVKVSAI